MAQIASDTFTDSNGTLLQSHTPSGGGTWTKGIGASGVDIEIQSDRASPSALTSDFSWYYHSVDPTGTEYDCTYTVGATPSSAAAIGMTARASTTAETGYLQWTGGGSSHHYLYVVTAGAYTELGTYAVTATTNDVIKLEIKDATKRVFVNGTQRISSTDNTHSAKGKVGLRCYGTNTAYGVDNWSVDEAGEAIYTPPRFEQARQAVVRASRW